VMSDEIAVAATAEIVEISAGKWRVSEQKN
jgi:hypothetical protein